MPTVEIDDNDPSISYSGPWGLSGNSNEFRSTTHYVGVEGAQFSLAFEGIAIAVYGTITAPNDHPGAVSQYAIDGGNFAVYKSPTVSSPGYHTLFFQSPPLTHGQHLLFGTTISSNTSFYLDYIVITTPDEGDIPPQSKANIHTVIEGTIILASSSSSPTPSFLPPSPSSPLSPSQSPSPPPLSPASATTSQRTPINTGSEHFPTSGDGFQIPSLTSAPSPTISKRIQTGAIAGAVAAGVLIIVVLVFLFLWHRRRKSKKYSKIPKRSRVTRGDANSPLETSGITPFTVSGVLEVDQGRSKGDILTTIPPNPIYSPEASFFTDLPSTHRDGIWEGHFINSDPTPGDGRVTKSSYHSRPDFARVAPRTSPLLVASMEAPSLTVRSSGSQSEVHWTTRDDSSPPAYQVAERGS